MATLCLAACSGGDAHKPARVADGTGEPVDGGTVVLAVDADFVRPFPLFFASSVDGDLDDVLYQGLARATWKDGELTYEMDGNPMALARSSEYVTPDSSALRYHMKQGLRWSDGQPITSADVVWTFRALKDPRYQSPREPMMAAIDSVTAQDDSTVTFWFGRYNPQDVFLSAHPVAPAHKYRAAAPERLHDDPSLAEPDSGRMPVSGAFFVSRRRHGSDFTLERNPYFRPRAHLDRIVGRVMPDPTSVTVAFRNREVDLMAVTIERMRELQRTMPSARFDHVGQRNYTFLAYNPLTVPAFRDAEVRRALGMALDVPHLLGVLGITDLARPAAGPYPPTYREYFDSTRMRPLAYDLEGARRILLARGWKPNAQGLLEKDGKPFRFTMLVAAGNSRAHDTAVYAQSQWRKLGIEMGMQEVDGAAYVDLLRGRRYEAAFSNWAIQLDPDLTYAFGKGSDSNVTSYASPAYAALAERAQHARSRDEANRLWQDAAVQVIRDQPVTFLWNGDAMVAYGPALRGARLSVFSMFENPWEWWSPREYQRRWTIPPPLTPPSPDSVPAGAPAKH
jgi:peptide/nickel transport system substrate-binding protein